MLKNITALKRGRLNLNESYIMDQYINNVSLTQNISNYFKEACKYTFKIQADYKETLMANNSWPVDDKFNATWIRNKP